mgnify:FL=1
MLRILIDTNIFIPLEPKGINDVEPTIHKASEFFRKTQKAGALVYLLDAQKKDINRDSNYARRYLRALALEKYQTLKNVQISDYINKQFDFQNLNAHNSVDVSLLNALYVNAISILVTNDNEIHTKARSIDLSDKVYRLEDALDFINSQLPIEFKTASMHPVIQPDKCFNLDIEDSFFNSLRDSYPDFNNWFRVKCQQEHRNCFVIRNNSKIAGLCIYKKESPSYEMFGNVIKICTFKLSYSGTKHGELLLRQLLKLCYDSKIDWLYVTAFESNYICQFFEEFGFEQYKERKADTGELIYRKKIVPSKDDCQLAALPFHKKFGYRFFNPSERAFLIPTIESYYNRLFPETDPKGFSMFADSYACANAIRKVYICKSNSNLITPGSLLFFYRTHSNKKIKCCGIVEQVLRSSNPDEILPLIGKRSVFSKSEIENYCSDGRSSLLILFRQAENLKTPCCLDELRKNAYIKGYPQTITKISEEAKRCILNHMQF